jgi:hypothetical protein
MSIKRHRGVTKGPAGGLRTIRDMIAVGRYDWTEKLEDAIDDGRFQPEDLELCVATGVVTKTSKDRLKTSTGGKVYTIVGRDCTGCDFYTAGKIVCGRYLFITARRLKRG